MFGFSAFSQAPFSTLGGASGPFVFNVSIAEAANVTDAQTNIVTFVADLSDTTNNSADQTFELILVAAQDEAIQASATQDGERFVPAAVSEQFFANGQQVASFIALASISEAVIDLDSAQVLTVISPAFMVESITVSDANSNLTLFDGRSNEAISTTDTFNGIVTQFVNISENITVENLEFPIRTAIAEQVENAEVTASEVGGVLIQNNINEEVDFADQIETITTFVATVATTVNLLAASDSEFIIFGEMSETVDLDTSIVALGSNLQFMNEAIDVNESSSAIGIFPAAQSESVSVFETQISLGTYITAIEENIAIFDGFDGLIVWILDIAEAINASEAYQQNQGYDLNINEATTNTDAITKSVAFLAAVAEAFNATAAQLNTTGFLASAAEAITTFVFNDTASDIRVNVDENIAIQDLSQQGLAFDEVVAETVNLAVNLIGIKYFNYYITDGVNVTSTQSGLQIATGNMSDSIQSADFYGNLATYFDSINEFANIIQVFDGLGTFYVSLGDQISVTQTTSVAERWIPDDNFQEPNWADPSTTQEPSWADPVNDQIPDWNPINSI
jgi:hypothetical protein